MAISFKAITKFFSSCAKYIIGFIRAKFMSANKIELENLALRSQLSLVMQEIENKKIPKPRCTPEFKALWMFLSQTLSDWKSALVVVKPETVIGWWQKGFKSFWKWKSKKRGRPTLSRKTIALIKRIHKENPLLSPEKIHERLIELAVVDAPSPNTIAKYIPKIRKPPTEKQLQSWKTFLKNHRSKIWSMDFFVVPTLLFKVLHVLIVLSHDRRKIEHFAVTTDPNSQWLVQQMREATGWKTMPEYLIHDNDPLFRSHVFQNFLKSSNIKSKRTGVECPWQNGVAERAIGIFRQDLLNHIIPVNEKHLIKLLHEYVNDYYNPVRTHQAIECRTPILSDKPPETKVDETTLKSEPILGGLYHGYQKVA